jgi:glycosyltransferase involved in cell wall biosynthesis
MTQPKVSIIIAFYNNPHMLNWVLTGFQRQDFNEFEIVIADDGSREEVISEIMDLKKSYSFPIQHVWHEDKGWRKTQILNKAVQASKSPYLVFIDGDCIPHRAFVREHFENRLEKTILAGRRVHLSKRLSHQLDEQKISHGFLEKPARLFWDSILSKPATKNAEKSIYLKSKFLRKWANRKPKDLLGCNLSLHKNDLLELNGFDERYVNPGTGEDTDIYWRSKFAGFKIKPVLNLAIQYHVWHKKGDRSKMDDNNVILNQTKAQGLVYTPFGIDKT